MSNLYIKNILSYIQINVKIWYPILKLVIFKRYWSYIVFAMQVYFGNISSQWIELCTCLSIACYLIKPKFYSNQIFKIKKSVGKYLLTWRIEITTSSSKLGVTEDSSLEFSKLELGV